MLATFQADKALLWAGVRDNYLFVAGGTFLSDLFLGSFFFPRIFVAPPQLSISEALIKF